MYPVARFRYFCTAQKDARRILGAAYACWYWLDAHDTTVSKRKEVCGYVFICTPKIIIFIAHWNQLKKNSTTCIALQVLRAVGRAYLDINVVCAGCRPVTAVHLGGGRVFRNVVGASIPIFSKFSPQAGTIRQVLQVPYVNYPTGICVDSRILMGRHALP